MVILYNPRAQPLLYIYIILLYRNRNIIELKKKMLRLDIRRRRNVKKGCQAETFTSKYKTNNRNERFNNVCNGV